MIEKKTWTLLGPEGRFYQSAVPGVLGGYRRGKIYGRLNCRSALSAIARGGYVKHRVFFLNALEAAAAGYRPCAVCMPAEYAAWKARQTIADAPINQTARIK
jgi:methylphosphotriester-DNA--protein-cysteine methyltransferase